MKKLLKLSIALNLVFIGLFISSFMLPLANGTTEKNYFIAEYTTGKAWNKKKDFMDQQFAGAHSRHLSALRNKGTILFGARYADKGIIFLSASNLEEAKKLLTADTAVNKQLFNVKVDELSPFYSGGIWFQESAEKKPPRVTGIGGIFFKAEDGKKMNQWYYDNLGLAPNDYGSMFEWRLSDDPSQIAYTQWSIFKNTTKYFEPSKKDFMINYRVENMEALVETMRKNGVTILDSIAYYDYGKFVHILDPENNKIELWEAVDVTFENLYKGKTTK